MSKRKEILKNAQVKMNCVIDETAGIVSGESSVTVRNVEMRILVHTVGWKVGLH